MLRCDFFKRLICSMKKIKEHKEEQNVIDSALHPQNSKHGFISNYY